MGSTISKTEGLFESFMTAIKRPRPSNIFAQSPPAKRFKPSPPFEDNGAKAVIIRDW
uniref:Uncharacterized protein n=1 Tax=viral metagenome TaxID=1070528 RepID=A0A6C0AIG5_9ZZZZ